MNVDELLSYLRRKDVRLWEENGRLRYQGTPEVMTQDLLSKIGGMKSEILEVLGQAARPQGSESRESPAALASSGGMDFKYVGNSGLKVSELVLGPYSSTMVDPGADDVFSRLLDTYVERGGNCFDLSNVYTRSEKRVGKWLKGKSRDDFVIATKVGMQAGEGANQRGLSRKHILSCIEKSLSELETDFVDIYYCHAWDGGTPLEEFTSTFDDLVRSGKVRYVGLSNLTGWQIQKAVDIAKYSGKEPFICLQAQYNLLDRYPEWEQLPVCRNEGLGFIAWGSLSAGWLTGRYRRDMPKKEIGDRVNLETELGMHHNSFEFKDNERTWRTLDALMEVAEEVEKTPAQVALNWLKDRSGVIPILGPRNVDQLKESLGCVGWSLTEEQRSELDEASRLPPIMPHAFLESVLPPDRW